MKNDDSNHKVFKFPFAKVYPAYIAKAENKGRTKDEVHQIIYWLTGYTPAGLQKQIKDEVDFEIFFSQAPKMNPRVSLITGVVCGVRVEDIKQPLMRNIRYLDKLIDELAKGRAMQKILREETAGQSRISSKSVKKTKKKTKKKTAKKGA